MRRLTTNGTSGLFLMLLYIFLPFVISSPVLGLPVLPSSPGGSAEGIVSSVVRREGQPDLIFPFICPSSCEILFHAEDNSSFLDNSSNSLGGCPCRCPVTSPVYLNTAGYCIEQLDECRQNIAFNSSHISDRHLPVVAIPATNGVILPRVSILWRESGIAVSPLGEVNCSVTGVFFDNLAHRWRASTKRALFEIATYHAKPSLVFRGSEVEASSLSGSVVQLKISCARFLPEEHCISFRVSGYTGANPYAPSQSSSRGELFIILLLSFLLIFSLLGSFLVSHVCWRIKKRRLISEIQMQFLYHFKQQQDAQKAIAVSSASEASARSMEPQRDCSSSHPPSHNSQKRRLYFSTDYLDKDSMNNPPPMAEQFLADLRRMIEMARDRIRMRRFVPMLISIPEEHEESQRESMHMAEIAETEESQESPRSESKSVDSGRESREDSDDSSRDGEEAESQTTRVQRIVDGFESRLARPSQLPCPRPPPRTNHPPEPQNDSRISQIPKLLGQASPRIAPRNFALPRTPSLPKTPPPSGNSYRSRKGYAVFPVDPMLNKSLPRRPKRSIPRPIVDPTK